MIELYSQSIQISLEESEKNSIVTSLRLVRTRWYNTSDPMENPAWSDPDILLTGSDLFDQDKMWASDPTQFQPWWELDFYSCQPE